MICTDRVPTRPHTRSGYRVPAGAPAEMRMFGITWWMTRGFWAEVGDPGHRPRISRRGSFFEGVPDGLRYRRLALAYFIGLWLDDRSDGRPRNLVSRIRDDGLDIDTFIEDQWLGGMSLRELQAFYSCRRKTIHDLLTARGHVILHGRRSYLPVRSKLLRIVREAGSYRAAGRRLGVTGQTVRAHLRRARPSIATRGNRQRRPTPPRLKTCGLRPDISTRRPFVDAYENAVRSMDRVRKEFSKEEREIRRRTPAKTCQPP